LAALRTWFWFDKEIALKIKKQERKIEVRNKKKRTEIIRNFRKMGFFEVFFRGCVGFWGKNGVWVNQARKKRSKTFENVQKYSNFE